MKNVLFQFYFTSDGNQLKTDREQIIIIIIIIIKILFWNLKVEK